MTNVVQPGSVPAAWATAVAPGPDRPVHPRVFETLERLGLDGALAPSDDGWRQFLAELSSIWAAGADRRSTRRAVEAVVAELAQAGGLASGTDLVDRASGLPNASALMIALHHALRSTGDSAEVAVLLVGLDGLGRVSDRLGEQGRREVLTGAAERIHSAVRAVDLVTRADGDEFGVLLGGLAAAEAVREISHRVERAFGEPLVAVGHYVYFTAHVGAALARAGSSATDAVRRARMALEWQRSTRNHPAGRGAQLRRMTAQA